MIAAVCSHNNLVSTADVFREHVLVLKRFVGEMSTRKGVHALVVAAQTTQVLEKLLLEPDLVDF